ncbi:MAG TPA: hypothetical protein VE175_15900 [Woeseiaceae bacterium]|nr:hypothetical protein [Woeseiaceae bacterium]
MELQVRAFVVDDLREQGSHAALRQSRRQQMVIAEADDLGDEQNQNLEPQAQQAAAEYEQIGRPVAPNQRATKVSHTDREQLGMAVLLVDKELQRPGIALICASDPAVARLLDDRATA